jgi:DNA primase catalytic subunit
MASEKTRPISAKGLNTFYHKLWLPYAANFVLHELATLGGTCKMEQRELVLQMFDFPHRNCVFRNQADVEKTLKEMMKEERPPVNIHFGPVWAAPHLALSGIWPPRKDDVVPEFAPNVDLLKPREFERKERGMAARGELVIDCDMDSARRVAAKCCRCGDAKRVCQTCWTYLMLPAQRIITKLLRDYFGFKRFFTAFSGRRGFHVWVMEPHVLNWTFWERRSFMETLISPLKPDADYQGPLCEFVWNMVLSSLSAGRSRADTFKALYPALDAEVATKPEHLHKLPMMLNANTGLFCDILADPDDEQYRFVASPKQLNDLRLEELKPEMLAGCVKYLQWVLKQ